MKFTLGIILGGGLSWLVTADHYGHIMRGDVFGGIMCRVYGLDTIRAGDWGAPPLYLCVNTAHATPESDLSDHFWRQFNDNFSRPR